MGINRPAHPDRTLAVYVGVIDCCSTHGWVTELGWGSRGYDLSVFEGQELIARGRSTLAPPDCFRRMAEQVKLSLERSKRLS